MRWLVVCASISGCFGSFTGNVRAQQLDKSDEVRVSVEEGVEFTSQRLTFGLRIQNRRSATVVFAPVKVTAWAGAWSRRLDSLAQLRIAPGMEQVVQLSTEAPLSTQLTLDFADAFQSNGAPLEVGSLRLEGPLHDVRNSAFAVTLRAVGGAVLGLTADLPLQPSRWVPRGALGGVEVGVGFSSRWVELGVTGRPGRGRLAGVEMGLHPWFEFVTVKAGYAIDLFGQDESDDDQFGHGPRFSVEALFDVGDAPLASKQRRTFGLFALGGWTNTFPRGPIASARFLVFEAGLIWRLR